MEVGPVAYSSPVIAEDGTIYVGNTDGELVAVNPDGTIRWKRFFPGAIISSPAVGDDGNIYVISTQKIDEKRFDSTLRSLEPDGDLRWSFVFPGNQFVTSSPKTLGSAQDLYVFVYLPGELFILDDAGEVVHQESMVNYGQHTICGSGVNFGDIIDSLLDFFSKAFDCWSFSLPPCKFDPRGVGPAPLYESFGWLDPTVAVVAPRDTGQPIVVVIGPFAIVAFRWSPPALSHLWSEEYGVDCSDDDYKDLSSPAVFANGLLVVGRRDRHVLAYDVQTGARMWDYDAKEAVTATPASFGRQVYVVVNSRLDVLDSDGDLLHQYTMAGQSVASPALSADLAYVNATDGLYTFTFDLESFFRNGQVKGGLSSPAIAKDGTVYVVDRNKKLWAFPGR